MATKITSRVIAPGAVTAEALAPGVGAGPVIANVQIANSSYVALDDTAVALEGGYILINGENFGQNVQVIIANTNATSVTYVSSSLVRAQVPAKSAGSYIMYLVNTDTGATAIRVNAVTYSGVPSWVTGSTLTEGAVDEAISIQLSANDATSYQLQSGSTLPTGLTLAANGLLSGTVTGLNEDTLYNFTIEAIDDENQDSPRAFSITITAGDPYINSTVLALKADSNTFITDTSTNSFTITPNGDTRPSAFSPYNTNWSNYFDGTGDYLTTPANSAFVFGTGDFTIECWAYRTASSSSYQAIVTNWSTGWWFGFNNGTFMLLKSGGSLVIGDTGTSPLNSWDHYCVSRSGSTVRMFVNGVLKNTVTDANDFSGNNNIFIGITDGSNHIFTGSISNLRIVKGTAVYTSNFTPPTSPLTSISGTSLLTCHTNRITDGSTNNFTITRNGDVKVTGFGPFTETDTATGSGYFDGTGDFLATPANTAFNCGTNNFTLEFWYYDDGTSTLYPSIFSSTNWTEGVGGVSIRYNNTGQANKFLVARYASNVTPSGGSGTNELMRTTNTYPVRVWHHVAFVRNGDNFRLYINGVLDGETTSPLSIDWNLSSAGAKIGGGNWDGVNSYIKGYVSNLRLVNGTAVYTANFTPPTSPLTAISGTSLLTLQSRIGYNNSQPVDESGVNNIITRNGNASVGSYTPLSPAGWSAYFDGTGDYLAVDQGSVTIEDWYSQDYTIELWVYPLVHSQSGTNGAGLYISHGVFNLNDLYWSLGTSSTGHLKWYYYNGTAQALTAAANPLSLNTWSHVALVYTHSTTTIKGYVNGVEVFSGTKSGTPQSLNTRDINIAVAQNTGYTGYLSNIRIVKGTAVYTSAFTPPTAPIESIANTSLLALRTNSFVDEGPNRFAITRNGDTKITPFSPFRTHTIVPDTHSVYFDGSGDYLVSPYSSNLDFATSDFTVEFWMNPSDVNAAYKGLIGKPDLSVSRKGWALFQNGSTIRYFTNNSAEAITTSSCLNAGTWTHIALVKNGITTTIYADGISVGTGDNIGYIEALKGVAIGEMNSTVGWNNTFSYTGYISNVRIIVGTAVYTSAFTPPTSTFTAIVNTSFLTCQSPTVIDNSNNAFAITVNGNAQPSKYNPFGETITTGVEYSLTNHGGSYYFDGTGDYLDVANVPTDFGSSANFTIEFWMYPTAITTAVRAIIDPRTSDASAHPLIWIDSSGRLYYFTTNATRITGTTTLTASRWYHVALVRNNGTTTLYLNGTSEGTWADTVNYVASTTFRIGQRYTSTAFNYAGYLSNLRVVKGTALYPSAFVPPTAPPTPVVGTILLLNGAGAAITDGVGKNVLETAGNARIINGVKKYGTGAMYFDGTGDWLIAPSTQDCSFETGNFTIESWIYPTLITGTDRVIWDTRSGASDAGLVLFIDSTGKLSTFAGGALRITSTNSLTANTWQHFALVRNSGTLAFYINGIQNGTLSYSATITCPGSVRIGVRNDGLQPYTGYIDDLRITKGIARYTSNFTPPTSFKLK